MAFIGNTNTTQAFTPAIDYFSGNASTTAFTLSRPVASVAQVQVVVNNVAQNPSSAYTVSSNTITFTSAPSSGTNNIYVYYTSPITQVIQPGQNTVFPSSLSTTNALYWDTSGNVGIGTTSPSSFGKLAVIAASGNPVSFGDSSASATNNGYLNYSGVSGALILNAYSTGGNTYQAFYTSNSGTNAERMRIDASGNVGIGTTNPQAKLHVNTTSAAAYIGYGANFDNYFQTNNNTYFTNYNGSTEFARIDSTGVFFMNSGYGSSAKAYGCRAWANFSGVGSVTVRGSGGVTSIAYTAAGKYTVSLSTTLPDLNYSLTLGVCGLGSGTGGVILVEDTGASSALSRTSSTFVLIHSYSFSNPGAGTTDNAISNNFAVFR